jgi:FAD/FMN-containing dehydrogenase
MPTSRLPWRNWSQTQVFYPESVLRPRSLAELQQIVREVSARGGRLKPVATGLSFSDILRTDDTLVEVVGLLGEAPLGSLLPLEEELFKRPLPATPLVRVPAGARIRQLNATLDAAGLAFTNLGGYDGQTLIGAISTSTHGSGLLLPPLCDGVRGLDLVASGGTFYRVEPSAGLCDPDKYRRRYGASRTLIQNDQLFCACLVSLGCLGVVYSVTMAVSPAYRLREKRYLGRWRQIKRDLSARGAPRRFRNFELTINPYPRRDGDYDCLVTERKVAEAGAALAPLPPARRSAESISFLASTQRELLRLMRQEPSYIPGILRTGFEALVTGDRDHVDVSHRVYNVGQINTAQVASGEYFFPLSGGAHVTAIERLLSLVRSNARRGIYQTTPFSLRFVAGSKAPLSMARGEPHASIEIALFTEMPHVGEAQLSYERLCLELGGRPHWGQAHELTGSAGWLRRAYPELDGWLAAYDLFNEKGVFDNHFTDRLGLSVPRRSPL